MDYIWTYTKYMTKSYQNETIVSKKINAAL